MKKLNGTEVAFINSALKAEAEFGEPVILKENEEHSFVGVALHGDGFVLSRAEAQQLLDADTSNADVVQPFLIGDDLNTNVDHGASRFAINFGDRTEEQSAKYVAPFEIVKQKVYPARKDNKRETRRKYWWRFGERAAGLYKRIPEFHRYLVVGKVSKHFNFVFLDSSDIVLDQQLTIVMRENFSDFALVQNNIHLEWSKEHSTTSQASTPRYNPSDCYQNYPFPNCDDATVNKLERLGRQYYEQREMTSRRLNLGFTDTFNLFHKRDLNLEVVAKASKQVADVAAEAYSRLLRLRELHRDMDNAVLAAYGWHEPSNDGPAIDLRHDFYEVDYLPENDRTRYTIHPDARRELLKRLLLLNHKRHAEEVEAAEHNKQKATKKTASKKKTAKKTESQTASLFDVEE